MDINEKYVAMFNGIVDASNTADPNAPILQAQSTSNFCAKRSMIVDKLKNTHGETIQSLGLQKNNSIMETFANKATGTWTILTSQPTGMSCLVAVGEAYKEFDSDERSPISGTHSPTKSLSPPI